MEGFSAFHVPRRVGTGLAKIKVRPGVYLLHLWKRDFRYNSLPNPALYWELELDAKGKCGPAW